MVERIGPTSAAPDTKAIAAKPRLFSSPNPVRQWKNPFLACTVTIATVINATGLAAASRAWNPRSLSPREEPHCAGT